MGKENTADRLKLIMEERNLRQVDVLDLCKPYCKKYGVTLGKSHLSHYLAGNFLPKQDKLTILAMALNVSEPWLMGYDVEPTRTSLDQGEIHLNRIEEMMLQGFRSLNEEGKEKAYSYVSDLASMDKYKKHGINDVVEGA